MGEVMILETLYTIRLSLRPIELRDLENLFLLRCDESSSNFNDSIPNQSEAETLTHINKVI
jgi:hypothetical protein